MAKTAFDRESTLVRLDEATRAGKLTPAAADHARRWLSEPRYAAYAPQVAEHVDEGRWQELDDAFWTVIPFGTGGRRGRMYPIGTNAINDRTIGESAQGLAEYVREQLGDGRPLSCAIAYDTRHNSRHFAELCASVMVANRFQVHFLEDYRSTPQLSFTVRDRGASCGIMVTASHNPPSDNAVKVYWSSGVQVLPPHDQAIIQRVMNVDEVKTVEFREAVHDGFVNFCKDEMDRKFLAAVFQQRIEGPRDLRVLYSPLHGVGAFSVVPALEQDGFRDVRVFEPHAEPNGDFPNVPDHVSNPENPRVFEPMIAQARAAELDLALATDPDCDRVGCAAPVGTDRSGPWATFTGQQIGVLLADFLLESRQRSGRLTPDHYLLKTIVTTEMIRRVAESYGAAIHGDLPVGFKWIGEAMDQFGPDRFVFAAEESHGYLTGQHVRDKDAVLASMLLAELAAHVKSQGKSLHEKLDALYWQHGYHAERLLNVTMTGSEGMARMERLMGRLRSQPPGSIGGLDVEAVRDYLARSVVRRDGRTESLDRRPDNLVVLELGDEGNYVAVRPSGTEPKVKFYMFTYLAPELLADLDDAKRSLAARLDRIAADLQALADET